MSKIQYILVALLTAVLVVLVMGPFMGAGVVSWSVMPTNSWFSWLGGFGWVFPQFPWPF
ncbi:MAG: hypothetical protein ACETWM_18565 [Candidatus Lokiarchaeia archaeon]